MRILQASSTRGVRLRGALSALGAAAAFVLLVGPLRSASSSGALREAPAPAGSTDAGADSCADLAKRYLDVWREPAGACTADADCSCHFADLVSACRQDVADQARATKLDALAKAFQDLRCKDHGELCSPYRCEATCSHGRCAQRSP